MLPLRSELAITLTGAIPFAGMGSGPAISDRTILILAGFASVFPHRAKGPDATLDEPPMTTPSPWWDPDVYADRRPFLLARGRIMAALRAWFSEQGFVEVETPV